MGNSSSKVVKKVSENQIKRKYPIKKNLKDVEFQKFADSITSNRENNDLKKEFLEFDETLQKIEKMDEAQIKQEAKKRSEKIVKNIDEIDLEQIRNLTGRTKAKELWSSEPFGSETPKFVDERVVEQSVDGEFGKEFFSNFNKLSSAINTSEDHSIYPEGTKIGTPRQSLSGSSSSSRLSSPEETFTEKKLVQLLMLNKENQAKWNPEKLSAEYNLKIEDVNNLLKYYEPVK